MSEYKLVPMEPTREMQKAYFDSIDKHMQRVQADCRFGRFDNHRLAYRAMLKAAPRPDTVEPVGLSWIDVKSHLPDPERLTRANRGILIRHEHGGVTHVHEVTELLVSVMKDGPRAPAKYEAPTPSRITHWLPITQPARALLDQEPQS